MPALAFCAAIASAGAVLNVSLPDRAAELPIVNANAYARRTLARLDQPDPARGRDLQQQARVDGARTFNSEPTNSAAVSLMALAHHMADDVPGARALYEDALLVAKRDRMANLWLIEDASANGRIGYVLDRYDVLLRTGGAASDALFDVLGTALREPVIIPYLEERLARRPPWAEQFWLRVAPHGAAIANIGRLRMRLLHKGVANPAGNDDDILRRLVGNGDLDIAFGLFRRLASTEPKPFGAVRNADFEQAARFPPFDWETFSGSGFGSGIDPKASALAIYTEDGVDTLAARQLMAAEPGRYSLSYRVRNPEALRAQRVTIRMRCADRDAAPFGSISLVAPAGKSQVSVPETACRYIWLEVWMRNATSRSEPIEDVLVDSIDMRRRS